MPWGREEDYKRNNAVSLYDLYDCNLAQEPLLQGCDGTYCRSVHIVVGDNMCLTSLHILSPHRCC